MDKWNYDKWNSYGIQLGGSHSPHMWAQALTHLKKIYQEEQFETLADVGCGCPPLDMQKIPDFSQIKKIIRSDGSSDAIGKIENLRVADFNNSKLPYEDKEVDFAISFEVIEHLFSTYGFLKELDRISKNGFLICKPNTDHMGINSKWYGENNFYITSTRLFDDGDRFEHINFIPNYEIFGFGAMLGYEVKLLDDFEEEIQFFWFKK